MTLRRAVAALAVLAAVAGTGACSSAGSEASSATPSNREETTTTVAVDTGDLTLGTPDRPAELVAPAEVTAPAPLLVLLHGYSSDAASQDAYLGVTEQAAGRGLYVLLPNGTTEPDDDRFWDASPACCNFTGTPVDDVAYLSELIDEAIAERPIDPDRVYLFGHSNGGFMAYRMACDRAEQIAAVAVLAGADQPEASDCEPSEPVSVLHLHGTDDELVRYDGGTFTAPFPGAAESVVRWVARDACDEAADAGSPLDLVTDVDGAETEVEVHAGSAGGATVQLDRMVGAGHIPRLDHEQVGTQVLDWLLQQAR